ncbi:hypothetical protein TKK_0004693 [Trichogramma kaykai]
MSRKRKRQSSPCHVSYEIDTSKKAYDDIITFPNPDVSGSDASDFDTYWGDEISDLTYKKTRIIILTLFNKRKSQRDYWSTDPFSSCEVISSAMSSKKFEEIKSKLKYSKAKDQNSTDCGWRVRFLLNLFQTYILKFGIWRSALSIDEMMVKSYARTVQKQFIRGKPIRFCFQFWGLCTSDGFVLGLDFYCGKNSSTGGKFTVRSEKSKEETGFFNISKKKKKVVKKSSSSKQQQQQQQPPAVKEKNVKIDGDENADDESSTRVSPVIESPIIGEVKPIDSVPPNITKESASKEDLDIVATVVLSDQQQQEQQQPPTLKDNNVKSDDERSAKDSPVIQSPRISESKSKEFVPSCTSKEGASEEDLDITATNFGMTEQDANNKIKNNVPQSPAKPTAQVGWVAKNGSKYMKKKAQEQLRMRLAKKPIECHILNM